MTRPIGEVFEYDGVTLEVVENGLCRGCYFDKDGCIESSTITGACSCIDRSDKKSVIFKEKKQ